MNELLHQLSSKFDFRDRRSAEAVQDHYRQLVYYNTLVILRETPKHFLPNDFLEGSLKSNWVVMQNQFFKHVKEKYKISTPSDVCDETLIDADESVLIDSREEFDEERELNEDEQDDDGEGYDDDDGEGYDFYK